MARSYGTGDNRRSVIVKLRVSLTEKQTLIDKANDAGLTISDMVRGKVLNAKPILRKPSPERTLLVQLLAALGKSGSNLNQVARQLNRKQENFEFEIPIREIEFLLAEFKELSNQLRTAFYGNHKR